MCGVVVPSEYGRVPRAAVRGHRGRAFRGGARPGCRPRARSVVPTPAVACSILEHERRVHTRAGPAPATVSPESVLEIAAPGPHARRGSEPLGLGGAPAAPGASVTGARGSSSQVSSAGGAACKSVQRGVLTSDSVPGGVGTQPGDRDPSLTFRSSAREGPSGPGVVVVPWAPVALASPAVGLGPDFGAFV